MKKFKIKLMKKKINNHLMKKIKIILISVKETNLKIN